jgi:hypothetical protein
MEIVALLGSVAGLGLMAGMRLYATILAVGLSVRLGFVALDPGVAHLAVLASTPVLVTAGIAYLLEFLADKIPWIDSLWDSIHTFVRPLGAAVLGATAVGSVNPALQIFAILICGGTAAASHATKAGTRILANHSPEPFSNVALSFSEDFLALLGTWFSLKHPQIMFAIAALLLLLFMWIAPRYFRLLRVEVHALRALIEKYTSGSSRQSLGKSMPDKYEAYLGKRFNPAALEFAMKCVAFKGVGGLRYSLGYLVFAQGHLVFLTRRWCRFRIYEARGDSVTDLEYMKGLFLDVVSFVDGKGPRSFFFFKDNSDRCKQALAKLGK